MSVEAFRKRILYRHLRPNPLFEDWLRELHTEAVEKGSKLEPMLREAFESIKKYPLPLKSGADCAILKGFHKKLCKFIDHRFTIYESIIIEELRAHGMTENVTDLDDAGHEICERTVSTSHNVLQNRFLGRLNPLIPGQRMPQQYVHYYFHNLVPKPYIKSSFARPLPALAPAPQSSPPSTSNTNTQKPAYKPGYRTGGYALLLTLLKHSQSGTIRSLPKEKLMELAQQYCDESFTVPKPGTNITAWSCMMRLVKKGLVHPIRKKTIEFALSEEGKNVAIDLLIEDNDRKSHIPMGNSASATVPTNVPTDEMIQFSPGTFDIILLIDKNETGGVTKKNEPTVELFNKYPHMKHEFRSLKVGDFTWIARHHTTNQELVLPYIVERKRMDDLAASIKDGRFHEQKFRLHKCGIPNVFYMIESHGKNKNLGLPLQSLKQALANTLVQDGFKTIMSDCLSNSVRLLALLTLKLTAVYKNETLVGRNGAPQDEELMTYEYFNMTSAKNKSLTVKEMFIKQLLQLKGLSVEKALAITSQYPTPLLLVEEYKKHDAEEGQMLLANLKNEDTGRNVGSQVSRAIYQLFSNNGV